MKQKRRIFCKKILFSLSTHILISYLMLTLFSAIVAILTIRHILFLRVEERVEKSLTQEIEELQLLTKQINPKTHLVFGHDLNYMFKLFLRSNIPDDDEFLVTILNGKILKSSPVALPNWFQNGSDIVRYLSKLTTSEQGKFYTTDGEIIYLAQPVIQGKDHGVFVVFQGTATKIEQVNKAVFVIVKVVVIVVVVVSFLAWLIIRRLLNPLRLLTEASQTITESDLTRRIPVTGVDEIAELTSTFNGMLERLETAFSSQRDFINDASHELRTPITIIRGHLELLSDDPQEKWETIELVLDELDRMSRFVNDLLLLTKAEQPNFLNIETLEISALTQEFYNKAQALAPRDWRLDAVASGLIKADRHRLTQAIMNLAVNATQHTQAGDVIRLGSVLKNNQVLFWVHDTGPGIPLTEQKRIFSRFARGFNNHRSSDGAGLGLAIVQAIVEAHKGSIELFSRPHEGATFTIMIPYQAI